MVLGLQEETKSGETRPLQETTYMVHECTSHYWSLRDGSQQVKEKALVIMEMDH